ncbi:MAG: LTA synthase family protein [Ruminococcus sp.]|nr:LTA synthase family protein [Ruminococcus sp.]
MKKIELTLRKFRKSIIEYIATNRLFLSYCFISMLGLLLLRNFTVNNMFSLETFIVDLALVLIIGSFGYLFKPKNQYRYFLVVIIIFTIMEVINSIYYSFYYSFASFGELGTLGQTETVANSIYDRLRIIDVIYVLFPFVFLFLHKKILRSAYYSFMSFIEKGKKMFTVTLLVGCIFLAYTFVTATASDYSRLSKLWNRQYIVQRFGIVLYQCNDLIQTLTPKINSLFGYEEAVQKFIQYFTSDDIKKYDKKNKYTNVLDGYNIVFVHMEGMETYLMDLKFNGVEATPNLNKLAKEGMFFSKFYPQISVGTSSDTEFTLLTSLMPAQSGSVFTNYYDREYITIPKLLKEKGYYTFSMHGNLEAMWNRSTVHPLLGYDHRFFKDAFTFNDNCDDEENMECINLGISDKLFFEQAMPILENIEKENNNYMGTVITLSNHSPFIYLDKYGEYDMSTTYEDCNEYNVCEKVTSNYLYNTPVGNYISSAHYADAALGDFIKYINESDYFENTVFVFYGDHDAKLKRTEKEYLYNYDYKTGKLKEPDDPTYVEYDYYAHELNKKTPLVIWTKNSKLRSTLNGEVDYVMGMYDVMPTLGNMLGIKNDYAFGHDIFNIKYDNFVVFPNGNFVTNMIYYNSSSEQSKIIKEGAELTSDYITNLIAKSEQILEVSNAIVVHDLIKNEGNKVEAIKEGNSE